MLGRSSMGIACDDDDTTETDEWSTGQYDTDDGYEYCIITQWEGMEYTCHKSGNGVNCDTRRWSWEDKECNIYKNQDGDGGGGGTGNDPDKNKCEEGANPFKVYDGNVTRKVVDIKVAGAARGTLDFLRYHNSVPRPGAAYFGGAGSWRHSWQYDLIEYQTASMPRPEVALIYPSGLRRVFAPLPGGGWAPHDRYDEKIRSTDQGYDVTTASHSVLKFVRQPAEGRESGFELRTITDAEGLVTILDYTTNSLLARITEPAGRSLRLTYGPVKFKKGVVGHLSVNLSAPASGEWVAFAIPENVRGCSYRELRLRIVDKELSFTTAQVRLGDGIDRTLLCSGRLGLLDLSAAGGQLGSTVQVRVPAGQEAILAGAILEATQLESSERLVLVRVDGSDGRAVTYDYTILTEPKVGREFLALDVVHYGDETEARYRYEWPCAGVRPQLTECDDPRYEGRAQRIRYAYHPNTLGKIHQEINPTTGGVYASLETDPVDSDRRVVRYSDLRQISYRVPRALNGRPTERVDGLGRKARFEYANNGQGRLKAKISAAGRRDQVERDQSGRVKYQLRAMENAPLLTGEAAKMPNSNLTVQARSQRILEHDAEGRVVYSTDHAGRATTYERDARGRTIKLIRPDGPRSLVYDQLGRVTSFTQRDGGVHHVTYDERGLKTSWTSPRGEVTRYEYDKAGRRISITDPLGRTTLREVNERGLATKIITAEGTTHAFAYDTYGHKISDTNEHGQTEQFAYDDLGRVVRWIDRVGEVTTYEYGTLAQGCSSCTLTPDPTVITYPDGRVTRNLYDAEGRLLARTENAGTSAQATTTYTYDEDNNLIAVVDALNRVTRYTYDDEGHHLSTTDSVGHATLYAYDGHGNLTSVIGPDQSETKYAYDKRDRRIRMIDALGNATLYAFDSLDNIVAQTDPTGCITRSVYDGKRLLATIHPDGSRETIEYDALGRPAKTTNASALVTTTTYDHKNHVLATSDSSGRKMAYTYDSAGRRASSIDAFGHTTKWIYSISGQIITEIRPDGVVGTQNRYDEKDRLISTTDALGHVTQYEYTKGGHLAALTDARGNTCRFSYDGARRLTSTIYPDASKESWTYNLVGQLQTYTNRAGQTKTVLYDSAGRPEFESWSGNAAPSSVYHYNAVGKLVGLDNDYCRLSYTYDALGHITSETVDVSALVPGLAPRTVGYTYDVQGRAAGIAYPGGALVDYQYDAMGRLEKIEDGTGKGIGTYHYDASGKIEELTRENGVATRYRYDVTGQLTDVIHVMRDETLASSHYELDSLGRRIIQTREDEIPERYFYDAESQILAVNRGTGVVQKFTYDPMGNRTRVSNATPQGTRTDQYTTNILNQYTSKNSVPFSYDRNGNLLSDNERRCTYNASNQLITVEAAAVRAEFFYDGTNRCVVRKYSTKGSNGEWILNADDSCVLTYDYAWNLLSERTLGGAEIGLYVHGLRKDEMLVAVLHTEKYYPLTDGLGTSVALSDASGRVHERYRTTACGSPVISTPTYIPETRSGVGYRFFFTGREWLPKISLNDHRNRYYSPDLGRWLSTDPIRFKSDNVNLYAYVSNRYTDINDLDGTNPVLVVGGILVGIEAIDIAAAAAGISAIVCLKTPACVAAATEIARCQIARSACITNCTGKILSAKCKGDKGPPFHARLHGCGGL